MTIRAIAVLLVGFGVAFLLAPRFFGYGRPETSTEFHRSYPLESGGQLSLMNIYGDVKIKSWDLNEVKVDATKYADSKEALAEAAISVEASANSIDIKTRYPESCCLSGDRAKVDYVITVPRNAHLQNIKTINGSLDIDRVEGSIIASAMSGSIDVRFNKLGKSQKVSLRSRAGNIQVTLPSDASAQVDANTTYGGFSSDFSLPVKDRRLVGVLGAGDAKITLNTFAGGIMIRRGSQTSSK